MIENDISACMATITNNLAAIKVMAGKKREIYGEIQQTMRRKAAAKEKMTFEQILEYQRFSDFYDTEITTLNRRIDELGVVLKITKTKWEGKQKGIDYAAVCANLNIINQKQRGVINGLESVVEMGKRTLEVL